MPVADVIELSSTSRKSFDDAIPLGIARASKTVRDIRSAWIRDMRVDIQNGKVSDYQVNMAVTFVLQK